MSWAHRIVIVFTERLQTIVSCCHVFSLFLA